MGNQSAKSAEPSLKVHPKKLDKQTEFKIPAKTTTLQNQKQEVNLNQAPANKKIVFNAEGATSKKAINNGEIAKVNRNTSKSTNQDQSKGVNETNNAKTTIATPQQQQNKKIVFDAEYLEESRKKNAAINEATKGQESSSSGEPWYKLLIRPDAPWYHQGKKLKPVDKTPSPEEIRKCEIEGQKYLEEDTANYIKGKKINP